MNKQKTFIALGIFWLMIIGGFIGYKEFTLKTGQEILLKTVPVDPRDLFRGDYVILRYDISRIDPEEVQYNQNELEAGDRVYVVLSNKEGYGIPTHIHSSPPNEGLFIGGQLKDSSDSSFNIEYGIESYFVPEGEGKVIERQIGEAVDVMVAIDRFGKAAIKALLINGKEVSFE